LDSSSPPFYSQHETWASTAPSWSPEASKNWDHFGEPNRFGQRSWSGSVSTASTVGVVEADAYTGSSEALAWSSKALSEEPFEVHVVNSERSDAFAALIRDIDAADLVGFDAEWVPDFKWGSDNPISVLQLAFPVSGRVFVIQLGRLNRFPQAVQMMLVNPGVTKVGFAVGQNDSAKLKRSGIAITNQSVVDVQESCASYLQFGTPETLSLKKAAVALLGYDLKKSKRCTCSDWASLTLTAEQVHYAALDAWVALRLYYVTAC
jgi:hypothetical protein